MDSGGIGNSGEEEEKDNESGDDDGKKTKVDQTPLWKYVTTLERGKGGGTTKFTCPQCKITYTGSYTHAIKHL